MSRTVLDTGGTSGIGRAIAERFAADQAEVFITGRTPDTVEQTAKELGVHGVVCDASDAGQVEALAARLGELDVLVNAPAACPKQPLMKDQPWPPCSPSGTPTWRRTCSRRC